MYNFDTKFSPHRLSFHLGIYTLLILGIYPVFILGIHTLFNFGYPVLILGIYTLFNFGTQFSLWVHTFLFWVPSFHLGTHFLILVPSSHLGTHTFLFGYIPTSSNQLFFSKIISHFFIAYSHFFIASERR